MCHESSYSPKVKNLNIKNQRNLKISNVSKISINYEQMFVICAQKEHHENQSQSPKVFFYQRNLKISIYIYIFKNIM